MALYFTGGGGGMFTEKITFWELRESLHVGCDYCHLVAVCPKWKGRDKGQASSASLGVEFMKPQPRRGESCLTQALLL